MADTPVQGQRCGHEPMHSHRVPHSEGPHARFNDLLLLKTLVIFEEEIFGLLLALDPANYVPKSILVSLCFPHPFCGFFSASLIL